MRVNVFLKNSSPLTLFMLHLIASSLRKLDLTLLLLTFFLSAEVFSFSETLTVTTLSRIQEVLLVLVGRRHLIKSSLQICFLSTTLTLPLRRSCFFQLLRGVFRNWVPSTFLSLSSSLCFHILMNVIFLSISRKRLGITCSSLLLNTVLLQRYTALSFFSTAIHSIFLVLDVTKSSHLFDRINRQSRAWLFFEVEEPIRERRKAFCSAQKENRELITRLLDMLHLSLQRLRGGIKHDPISPSHKTDSHSVYSLFQSVAVLLHFPFLLQTILTGLLPGSRH